MNTGKAVSIVLIIVALSVVGYTLWYEDEQAPVQSEQPAEKPEFTANSTEQDTDVDVDVTSVDLPSRPSEASILDTFPSRFTDPFDRLRKLDLETSEIGIRATLSDESQSTEARYWSAIALGKSQSADAGNILEDILKNDDETDMQIGAVAGLAYLGDPKSLNILENTLNYHPNSSLRSSIISALLRNPSQSTHDIVSRTVVDQSQELNVRLNAFQYLALTESPAIANTMRTLLADSSAELRASAAVALSREYRDEAMSHLVSAALDDDLPLEIWGDVVLRLQEMTEAKVDALKPIDYFTNSEARSQTKIEIENWWRSINSQ